MDPAAQPPARSVLVTGGSRGIGRAVTEAFLAAGDQVAVTVRSDPATANVPAGALAVYCDVTSTEQVDAAFSAAEQAHGPVGVVISNAGLTRDQLLVRMADADVLDVLDANLVGAVRVARRAAPSMMRARWGRLIFISSVVGLSGSAGQAPYAAAKAGLVGLARSLARELASRAITANVVAPGPVATDMLAALSEAQRAAIVAQVPAGRVGTPEEVAAVVRFLATAEAGYVTGAVIPVDGGLGMGH